MDGGVIFIIILFTFVGFVAGQFWRYKSYESDINILKKEFKSEKEIMRKMHEQDRKDMYEKYNIRLPMEDTKRKIELLDELTILRKFKGNILTYVNVRYDEVGNSDDTLNGVLKIISHNKVV